MYKSNCKIVLADDHPIMLKGLKQELKQIGYSNISTCNDGKQASELIFRIKPDLIILDIEMPYFTGFEVIEKCKKHGFNIPSILISYHKERSYILAAKKMGVEGFMLKEDSIEQIDYCIQQVMRRQFYYSNSLDIHLLESVDYTLKNLNLLTHSEIKILKLIASNFSSSQIAHQFSISQRTVEKHRANIIPKIQSKTKSFSLRLWAKQNKHLINTL